MTGFGLYETLRILVPGATAVAVLDFVVRVATGSGAALSKGPFQVVVEGLHGTNFFAASLMAGFLLYLLDLPQRSRIGAEGDPGNGIPMPTTALREILGPSPKAAWVRKRSFSLYFLLTDAHLPAEFHRRIYFFGSIFRIYSDARYLTAAGMAIGVPLAFAFTGQGRPPWIGGARLLLALLCVASLISVGVLGELRHADRSVRKHKEGTGPRYRTRLRRSLTQLKWVAILVGVLESVGIILSGQYGAVLRGLGLVLCGAGVVLWGMADMGPPPRESSKFELRFSILAKLGVERTADSQLTPAQRTALDVALFGPALVGAAVAAQQQGRPPEAVFLWMALALTATVIMAVRKHEIRWLNSLRDQLTWLTINSNNIADLGDNALRRGTWS